MWKSGNLTIGISWSLRSSMSYYPPQSHAIDNSKPEPKAAKKPAAQNKPAGLPNKPSMISSKPSMISSKPSMISSGPKPTPPPEVDESAPPLFRPKSIIKPTKEEALKRTDGLANGFVLLDVAAPGAEEAWSWVIEGKNEPTLCACPSTYPQSPLTTVYDIDLLHKYARAFPDSPMTDFIDDYCRWFQLPLPEPEEVDESKPVEAEQVERKGKGRKNKNNARERRKARRLAGQSGAASEDLEQEEKEELVAEMTVRLSYCRLP